MSDEKLVAFDVHETIGVTPVNPVFGGTSLSELEAKAKVWGHQQEAAAIERGCQQGMTLEMLDTVFDIACQQVPACTERWMKLKADLHVMLCRRWAKEEMPK